MGYGGYSGVDPYQQFYPGYGTYYPGQLFANNGLGYSYQTATNYGTSMGAPYGGSPPEIAPYYGYYEEDLFGGMYGGYGMGGYGGYGYGGYGYGGYGYGGYGGQPTLYG